MPGRYLYQTGFALSFIGTIFASNARAEDSLSWTAIDFHSCPLTSPLRVADKSAASQFLSLQGCAARIIAAPRAPIRSQPDIARIVGVKADGDSAGRRKPRGEAVVAPPPGTRRIAYMPARPVKIDARYDPHILATASAHRIDPLFLHAIIGTESTYMPAALSHAGARGLMQVMPATGARFGVTGQALYDPATNIETGARLLKSLQRRYGNDFNLILAAYNAGEGAVAKYGNRIPPYRETQDYVVKVMGRYTALRGATDVAAVRGQAGS